MTYYFNEEEVTESKKKKNFYLAVYYGVLSVYLIVILGLFLWYGTLPYQSPDIVKVKMIAIIITVVFVIFSFVYLMIPFGRARAYYLLTRDMKNNIRENFTGKFLGVNNTVQDKNKVDMISLRFSVFNKYKNEDFERKVLIFADKEIPEITLNATVDFTTQSNVLICYEEKKEK